MIDSVTSFTDNRCQIASDLSLSLIPLRRRSDFVRVQKSALRWVTPGFVVVCEPVEADRILLPTQIGFTITKKIGNAVVRNRIRRRFRSLTREILPAFPNLHGWTIILLARHDALTRDYTLLGKDLRWALRKLQAQVPAVAHSTASYAASV